MRDLDQLFATLAKSRFRSRFRLEAKDRAYLQRRGLEAVLQHGHDLLQRRLVPAGVRNDGRQTPMRGHPVFVAQHATATCCRSCLAKWHAIPAGRALSQSELEYVLEVIRRWLERTHPTAGGLGADGPGSVQADRQRRFALEFEEGVEAATEPPPSPPLG